MKLSNLHENLGPTRFIVYVLYDIPPNELSFDWDLRALADQYGGSETGDAGLSGPPPIQRDISFEFSSCEQGEQFEREARRLNIFAADLNIEEPGSTPFSG